MPVPRIIAFRFSRSADSHTINRVRVNRPSHCNALQITAVRFLLIIAKKCAITT